MPPGGQRDRAGVEPRRDRAVVADHRARRASRAGSRCAAAGSAKRSASAAFGSAQRVGPDPAHAIEQRPRRHEHEVALGDEARARPPRSRRRACRSPCARPCSRRRPASRTARADGARGAPRTGTGRGRRRPGIRAPAARPASASKACSSVSPLERPAVDVEVVLPGKGDLEDPLGDPLEAGLTVEAEKPGPQVEDAVPVRGEAREQLLRAAGSGSPSR